MMSESVIILNLRNYMRLYSKVKRERMNQMWEVIS